VLEPSVLDLIAGDTTSWETEPLESLAIDGQLMAFHHHGFWQPMDTLRDKNALDDLWRAGAAPWKLWS
jgi:glucose-1-phosphate cytidylyltransferase